jgi:hypothetical protein
MNNTSHVIKLTKIPPISPWDMKEGVHQWMRIFTNMSPEVISKTPKDRLLNIAIELWEDMREKKSHKINWYKMAQNQWRDFQWNEPGFKYKQCFNCGRFFLPNKTFSYPPGTTPQKSMNDVLQNIDPQTKEEYLINKDTITHGLCPKCFIEQMQRDLGFSYDEARAALSEEYPEDIESLYLN